MTKENILSTLPDHSEDLKNALTLAKKSLDRYYELRGWNSDGIPTQETINDLGLAKLVNK